MKTLGTIFGMVLGVALSVALAAGGYFGFKFFLELFGTLEPQVATITATASVVAVVCAAIIAGGFRGTSRKEVEVQVRAEKSHLYERLSLIWGEKLSNRTQAVDQTTEDELQQLERLLTLRGNSKVIKTYGELQVLERNAGLQSREMPSQIATLLLDMRKDLGLSVLNLNESDLMTVLNVEMLRNNPVSTPHVGKPEVSLS